MRPISSLNFAKSVPPSEPFTIESRNWNDIVRYLRDRLGASGKGEPADNDIPHAWKMLVRWEPILEQWVAGVTVPGFVRGWDVAVNTIPYLTEEKTRARLEIPDKVPASNKMPVRAFLTEFPEFPIGNDQWVDVASYGKSDSVGSRSIPEWLLTTFNILVTDEYVANLENLSIGQTNIEEALFQDKSSARLLRRIEVVLRQPRPTVEPVIDDDPLTVAGETVEAVIRYTRPVDSPPRLELSRLSPAEETAQVGVTVRQALGDNDPGYDVCPIATIWLCGPPGKLYEEKVGRDWLPIVQYHTFYSLDYTVNAKIMDIPPVRITNPAAGLISGSAAQLQVDIANEINRQMEEQYAIVEVNGAFWTV